MAREILPGANGATGAAIALTANTKAVATSNVDLVSISAPQILRLKRLEIRDRLGAGRMVEVVAHTVTK